VLPCFIMTGSCTKVLIDPWAWSIVAATNVITIAVRKLRLLSTDTSDPSLIVVSGVCTLLAYQKTIWKNSSPVVILIHYLSSAEQIPVNLLKINEENRNK